MSYIEEQLKEINRTKKQYINDCKKCFLKESEEVQDEIENADTEELDYTLHRIGSFTPFENYCDAIRYELMRRNNFEERI